MANPSERRPPKRKLFQDLALVILAVLLGIAVLRKISSMGQAKTDSVCRWLERGATEIIKRKAEHLLGLPVPAWGGIVGIVHGPNFDVVQLADKQKSEAIDLFVSNSGNGLRLEAMMGILDAQNKHIRSQHDMKQNRYLWSDFAPSVSGQRMLHFAAGGVLIDEAVFPRLEHDFVGRTTQLTRNGRVLHILAFGTNRSFDDDSFDTFVRALMESPTK